MTRYSVEWLRTLDRATVTAVEAGHVLGVDPRTIRRMVDRGELHGRRSLRIQFVTIVSLLAFLDPGA